MKQKLLALLRTLFASKGLNAKEYESLADLLIQQQNLTDDSSDDDLTAASESAKPYVEFTQKVASRFVSDVKKTTEEKKDPATPSGEDPKPSVTDDMPEWAKALVKSTENLAKGLESIKTEKVGATRREQYSNVIKDLPEALKTKALKDFDRLSFKDDDDFNSWLTESIEDVKTLVQENANEFGISKPVGGVGGVDSKKIPSAVKEFIKKKADERQQQKV